MTRASKDTAAGALFFFFGLFFTAYALGDLRFGTAFRMGPGFFPVVVGGLLAAFGVAIFVRGLWARGVEFGAVAWRGVVLIPGSLIAFGLLARPLGLVPSLLILCFTASFSSTKMTIANAVAMSLGMTFFCVVLFSFVLGLSLPLWGDVFR